MPSAGWQCYPSPAPTTHLLPQLREHPRLSSWCSDGSPPSHSQLRAFLLCTEETEGIHRSGAHVFVTNLTLSACSVIRICNLTGHRPRPGRCPSLLLLLSSPTSTRTFRSVNTHGSTFKTHMGIEALSRFGQVLRRTTVCEHRGQQGERKTSRETGGLQKRSCRLEPTGAE